VNRPFEGSPGGGQIGTSRSIVSGNAIKKKVDKTDGTGKLSADHWTDKLARIPRLGEKQYRKAGAKENLSHCPGRQGGGKRTLGRGVLSEERKRRKHAGRGSKDSFGR